jgi:hypothetical protein
MAFDGENLWINDFTELKVYEVDPESGKVVSSFSYAEQYPGGLNGLAWDGEYLWLTSWRDKWGLAKFDRKGNFIEHVSTKEFIGGGLTFDGEYFWAQSCAGKIYKLTKQGEIVGWISSGSPVTMFDLAWDGKYLWSGERTNEMWKDKKIFKLEILKVMPLVIKKPSSITCSVSPSKAKLGEAVTVSGSISPPRSGVTVTIIYIKPDGSTVKREVTTNPEGKFTDTYRAEVKGNWKVRAEWSGDREYEGAKSETATFTIAECIIATTTYGSELTPEVQLLRGFRDKIVLSTFAGSQFMKLFYAWYYSFSPDVAVFIASHPQSGKP